MDFPPSDDPLIDCQVRLWKGESVCVFVHPREWKKVSITDGVPMSITCCGVTFHCRVSHIGEHYKIGMPKHVDPRVFGVPTHGDYPATARIDWADALPAILKSSLESSEGLDFAWRSLPCEEMRSRLSHVFRARTPGTVLEREFQLLRKLSQP